MLPLSTSDAWQDLRVLVVEDDPQSLSLTVAFLRKLGVGDIVTATNGAEAVVKGNDKKAVVDLVVCDWNMPVISGIDVTRALRQRRANLPIVMATGRGDAASLALAADRGVDGYLVNPFSAIELAGQMRRALAARARKPAA